MRVMFFIIVKRVKYIEYAMVLYPLEMMSLNSETIMKN